MTSGLRIFIALTKPAADQGCDASRILLEDPLCQLLHLRDQRLIAHQIGDFQIGETCLFSAEHFTGAAQQRLGVLRDSNDGFVIAQKDLELRGF